MKNIKLLNIEAFFGGLIFHVPILALLLQKYTGSATLAGTIIGLEFLFISFFEIPTGIFSDKMGRKESLLIGRAFSFISILFLVLGIFIYPVICFVISALMMALYYAFFSGTVNSLLFESLKDFDKEKDFASYYGKVKSFQSIGFFLSAILSMIIIKFISMEACVYVSIFSQLGCLMAIIFIKNPKFHKIDKTTKSIKYFTEGLKNIIINRKLRMFALANIIRYGTIFTNNKFQAIYFETLIAVFWIPFIRALKNLTGIISFRFSGDIIKRFKEKNVFISSLWAMTLGGFFYVLLDDWRTPFISAILGFLYPFVRTTEVHLYQQQFSDKERATMESIIAVGKNMFAFILSISVGVIADIYSVQMAIFALFGVQLFAIYFANKSFR